MRMRVDQNRYACNAGPCEEESRLKITPSQKKKEEDRVREDLCARNRWSLDVGVAARILTDSGETSPPESGRKVEPQNWSGWCCPGCLYVERLSVAGLRNPVDRLEIEKSQG